MMILNRLPTNHTLLLSFARNAVVFTRLCSDEKHPLEDEKPKPKKKGKQKTFYLKQQNDSEKLFSVLTNENETVAAKDSINKLKEIIKNEAEGSSISSSPKIELPTAQRRKKTGKNAELKIWLNEFAKKKSENEEVKGKSMEEAPAVDSAVIKKILSRRQLKKVQDKADNLKMMELAKSIDKVSDEFPKVKNEVRTDLLKKALELLSHRRKAPGEEPSSIKKLDVASTLENFERVEKQGKAVRKDSLGIFTEDFAPAPEKEVKLKIWNELQQEELKLLTSAAPRNYFEELIHWTEQGKLWHFPIDNEQGMDEEAKVDFSEHVFLEDQLDPWCPKVGPLRHFMELVTTGLGKNPYLTVEEKHEYIRWYRDYFENKKKLLISLGAFENKKISDQP